MKHQEKKREGSRQPEPDYQCSVCKRNRYDGDSSCPLDLINVFGNSDVLGGINRVIKSCGCGAFIDTRTRGLVPAVQSTVSDPFEWQFQPICVDKPCMHLFDKCPVKSECDTLKECEENWQFLQENPDAAIKNERVRKEHDAIMAARAWKEGYEQGEKECEIEHRTYEKCHRKFSCPEGEECWYSSEDYYWDCGQGAVKLSKAYQKGAADERERVLNKLVAEIINKLELKIETRPFKKPVLINWVDCFKVLDIVESLRSEVKK